jgi:hypothetical protein
MSSQLNLRQKTQHSLHNGMLSAGRPTFALFARLDRHLSPAENRIFVSQEPVPSIAAENAKSLSDAWIIHMTLPAFVASSSADKDDGWKTAKAAKNCWVTLKEKVEVMEAVGQKTLEFYRNNFTETTLAQLDGLEESGAAPAPPHPSIELPTMNCPLQLARGWKKHAIEKFGGEPAAVRQAILQDYTALPVATNLTEVVNMMAQGDLYRQEMERHYLLNPIAQATGRLGRPPMDPEYVQHIRQRIASDGHTLQTLQDYIDDNNPSLTALRDRVTRLAQTRIRTAHQLPLPANAASATELSEAHATVDAALHQAQAQIAFYAHRAAQLEHELTYSRQHPPTQTNDHKPTHAQQPQHPQHLQYPLYPLYPQHPAQLHTQPLLANAAYGTTGLGAGSYYPAMPPQPRYPPAHQGLGYQAPSPYPALPCGTWDGFNCSFGEKCTKTWSHLPGKSNRPHHEVEAERAAAAAANVHKKPRLDGNY